MVKENLTKTNYGISILRILATFSVIIIHISGPEVVKFGEIPSFDWNVANFYDSVSRYSVPVFFMISGSLLLSREFEIKDFLKNRLLKIIPPFLFWSLFYSLFNRYFLNDEKFDISKVVKDVFYGSEYHFWFVFSLIGVYLISPIFQKWIAISKREDIEYFLIIWIITLFLTIPGVTIYFPKINFAYFSGFLGYFILGYYLVKYAKISNWISYLLIFVGVVITVFGTCFFSNKNEIFYDYFYEYLSVNTLLVSVGIFLLVTKIENINIKIKKKISKLNECSFGIYLVHPFIINVFSLLGIIKCSINPLVDILILSSACFIVSFVLVFFIKKMKFGNLFA